jgi:tetratricopeptide (TPR) repeat protein
LALFRQVGSRLGEANVLRELGRMAFARGDSVEAEKHLRHAIELRAAIGDRYSEAGDRFYYADVLADLGRPEEARKNLTVALRVFSDLGLPYADWVREKLATLE